MSADTENAARRPRLVLVTANDVARDQSTQQLALELARDGWGVVVLARSPRDRRQRARLGPVPVVQVPVSDAVRNDEMRRREARGRGPLGLGFVGPMERAEWEAAFHARRRQHRGRRTAGAGRRRPDGAWRRAIDAVEDVLHRARGRVWGGGGQDALERAVGDWGRDHPLLLDIDLAFGPAARRLAPDVLVADGIATLPTVSATVARLRSEGGSVSWVYLARQHAATTEWSTERATSAFRAVELELAAGAERVVATTPEVAAALTDQVGVEVGVVAEPADLSLFCRDASGLSPEPRTSVPATAALRRVSEKDGHAKPRMSTQGWRALDDTPVRLGLGMANYAGQLSALARAVTAASEHVSVEVVTQVTDGSFGYPTDVTVTPVEMATLEGQTAQLDRVLPRYSHLLADAFLPVFGRLNGTDVAGDLPALAQAGVDVALLAHGSEIRDPRRHAQQVPESLFHDAPADVLEVLARNSERNRAIAAEAGRPVFVTTPDLLADVADATWVPLVVDVEAWACGAPVMRRSRPVVLHAPSRRWTKGTNRFLPALEALAESGAIELRLVEGQPWATMRTLVRDCDIVIDQVAIGSYGTFACEAMAAGKPVLVHVTDDVINTITERAGLQPPVLNVTGGRVAEAIGELLDDRSRAVELGREAASFVREVHDGRMSAAALDTWLRVDEHRND
jgi:hypothetical protein